MSEGSITALVETLVQAGATPELILAAVRTAEAQKDAAIAQAQDAAEDGREKARARWRKWKANQPSNVSKRLQTSANASKQLTRAEDSSSTSSLSGSEEVRSPVAPAKKGSRIPEDFQPDHDWAVSQGLPLSQAKFEAAQFTDYWRSKPGKDGLKLDWPGTWRMWVRNALKRQPSQRSASPPIPMKPRNAGEAARLELQRRGEYPDATHHETRYLDQSDGGPGFAGTGIARRLALAAGG